VAHLINHPEGGGCSETSKIIEKATDLLKCFFDDFENEKIFKLNFPPGGTKQKIF